MQAVYCKYYLSIFIISVILLLAVLMATNAAGEVLGADKEPDLSSTALTAIEHTTPSVDLDIWTVTATLDDAAAANGTTLELTTQICINSGVCFAPEPQEMTTTDQGLTWTGSVSTPKEHAYVNWRITTYFADDEQVIPYSGWAKTWSSCWVSFDIEGNTVSGGDDCAEEEDESAGFLPALGPAMGLAVFAAAALSRRSSGFQQ